MRLALRPLAAAFVAVAALLPLAAAAASTDKAKAKAKPGAVPAGFERQVYRGVTLLKPQAWNQRESADTLEFSPEAFAEGQKPENEFSIRVQTGYKAANGMVASKGLLKALKPVMDRTLPKNMLVMEQQGAAPKMSYVVRYRVAQLGEKPVIFHMQVMADDKADTLVVSTYQCPERDWKANWPVTATVIMESVTPGQ